MLTNSHLLIIYSSLTPGIHFDRTFKTRVEYQNSREEKTFRPKAMEANGIEQRHLFLLYMSVMCSLWAGSHNLVTIQPAEAGQGAK